ncbi:indolepyruvate ferredoxin oxidoreductase subunit alpha [Natranaerofaba carboxydovora]|uniref:indolepyruvate ferredoxin oxidoreductase subunit alpha n=1 Tax=Natranaerofaba carboxydovora TaxID=2742683 RepID=UPI001F13951D|nr:indolepyruvate ferredoxin oxidoreductase subunit alpha [Natranaerofaba carboxydovora]UMZ73806.1 hypothetical protein ACONDI_01375 [Natranaerofaba carboxydovora]
MNYTLLSGNEAIARGAFESGVKVAAAYPGTPSTEILQNVAEYEDIYAQWSSNEKVALEVGIGASIGGARTLVAMKHVGVNVAADPLMTLSYTGVNGGLVLVSADDPGMHSSQNEQDNRRFAKFAKIPLLEPSDSQEAKDYVGKALDISERFDLPVMLRVTTRISHALTGVNLEEPNEGNLKEYNKDKEKYVMIPAYGRKRHEVLENKLVDMKSFSENSSLNQIEWGDKDIGIITSGICYQYVKEALPGSSCLKLGFTHPLPEKLIKEFASKVNKLYVVEELEPYMEEKIKAMGIEVIGKEVFPLNGEISASMIQEKIKGEKEFETIQLSDYDEDEIPARPPVMCPGCSHRGVFYTLKKLKLIVTGDIGCYTLGCLPPLESIDSCVCMGASIGKALGMEKANPELKGKIVAVIGDSTYFHSGLTGTLDVAYNLGSSTIIILDNRTTAMTGHQDHPGTGKTLKGEETKAASLSEVVKAMGVDRVTIADPSNLEKTKEIVQEEVNISEPSVIIFRKPCALLERKKDTPYVVDEDKCVYCKLCLNLGCPALMNDVEEEKVQVEKTMCTGCSLCEQVCKKGAIKKAGDTNE